MWNFAQQVAKIKAFCGFFIAFLKDHIFWKKDEYPSLIISEIMDCERGGYLNVEKVVLQKTMR